MTTTPAPIAYRWDEPRPYIGRCHCGATVALTRTLDQQSENSSQARCPACNRWVIVAQVAGKFGKRECGAWCEDGTGKSCTCTCGGRNHGMTWRIRS